jgi:hypothetical protein
MSQTAVQALEVQVVGLVALPKVVLSAQVLQVATQMMAPVTAPGLAARVADSRLAPVTAPGLAAPVADSNSAEVVSLVE